MSIKTKMAWAVSLLVASMMAILALVSYHYLARTFKEAVASKNAALLDLAARHIDYSIKEGRETLAHAAAGLDPGRPEQAAAVLERLAKDGAAAIFDAGFQLVNAEGLVVAEVPADRTRIGMRLKGRDYVALALATGTSYLSAPYRSEAGAGRPTITLCVPIPGPDGSVAGVLAGHSDLTKVAGLTRVRENTPVKNGVFYLLDRNRTVIGHPDPARIMTRITPGESPGLDRVIQQHVTAAVEDVNRSGEREITAAYPLKEADLLLVSQYPVREAYAALHSARHFFGAALLLTLALTLLTLRILIRRLTAPLVGLAAHLRELPGKTGDERLMQAQGGDEVEALALAVNEMVRGMDRKEELLQENRELYRIIADFTSELALLTRPDGSIRYISPNCQSLTGYSDREFLSEPTLLEGVIHPRDRDKWRCAARCRDGEQCGVPTNLRIVTRQGELRWFNYTCHKATGADGAFLGIRGSFRDITQSRLLEAELDEQRRFAENLLEGTSTPLFAIDAEHRVIIWNRAMVELTGIPACDMLGTDEQWRPFYSERRPTLCDLVLDQRTAEIPKYYSDFEKEAVLQGVVRAEGWYGNLNGRGRYLLLDAAPIYRDGKVIAVVETLSDSTSRKYAERELQKKQAELVLKHEQLSALFRQVEQAKREWEQTMDCIGDMVVMVDSGRRIRRCNRAFRMLSGRPYNELICADWRELLKGVGLDPDLLEGGEGELFHGASGRWLSLRSYPYDDGRGAVITLHDLTEIKQVSEELARAYEELKSTHSQLLQQEKMASIGQLAAGVAHEINNPMGFISSNLGSMEKYLERLSSFLELQSAALAEHAPEQVKKELAEGRRRAKVDYVLEDSRNLLTESKEGAHRVRSIVQNLKSFSRVDEACASYVDLNDCLESTVTIAWNELKYKTTLNRDYGDLPRVKCLPQQLNQVFLNLLVNAAHAIEKQGEVGITTRHLGESVTVAIRDTGCGIPEAIRNRIFEPFFTTKEVGKGTGLGLSISYDIIKKHGGSIDVESETGVGTTFTITLPVEGVAA